MQTSEELLEEAIELLPFIGQWTSLTIPIVMEMNRRLRESPEEPRFCEIVLPGTKDPVFTEDQALELEDAFREVLAVDEELEMEEEEQEETRRQVGGGVVPPEMEAVAQQIGAVRRSIVSSFTADSFSPDMWFGSFKNFLRNDLPKLKGMVEEMGEIGGLTKYETILSDIHGVIPIVSIPFVIPAKIILPLLATFLEIIRFTVSLVPFVGTLSSLPYTLLLALVELGKGKLYESLLTLFGLIGTNGIVLGILAKLVLSSIVLFQPAISNIPDTVLDSGYKAGKATITSFFLQFLAIFSPDVIRLPLTTFTETMKQAARTFNQTVNSAVSGVTTSTQGKVQLDAKTVDIHQIPSFMDILSVQRLLQNPAFIAYPGVIDLIEQIRMVPPLPFIMDLFNIPRKTSPEFQEMIIAYPPGYVADYFTPRLKIKDPKTGEYIDINDIKETTFENMKPKIESPDFPSISMGDSSAKEEDDKDKKGNEDEDEDEDEDEEEEEEKEQEEEEAEKEEEEEGEEEEGEEEEKEEEEKEEAEKEETASTPPSASLTIPKTGGTRKNKSLRKPSRRNRF